MRPNFEDPVTIVAMRRCGFKKEDFVPQSQQYYISGLARQNQEIFARQQVKTNLRHVNDEINKIIKYGMLKVEWEAIGKPPVNCRINEYNGQVYVKTTTIHPRNTMRISQDTAEKRRVEQLAVLEAKYNRT